MDWSGLRGQAASVGEAGDSDRRRQSCGKVIHRMWESGGASRLNLLWVLHERLACVVKTRRIGA